METGGYKGRSRTFSKSELHALLSSHLGIPSSRIISEYGMCELSSQAYDTPLYAGHSRKEILLRRFRFSPWTRFQVISPETGKEVGEGQTGLLRIFDLANVYSLMAIQTEDLVVRHGSAFDLLGRAASTPARGCSLMSVA